MIKLLFETAQMMALTFAIGFVVAAIIKGIAFAANYFDFHQIHHDEIARKKKERKRKLRELYRMIDDNMKEGNDLWIDSYHGVSRGEVPTDTTDDLLHGVSKGNDAFDILQYYYPQASLTKEFTKESQTNRSTKNRRK